MPAVATKYCKCCTNPSTPAADRAVDSPTSVPAADKAPSAWLAVADKALLAPTDVTVVTPEGVEKRGLAMVDSGQGEGVRRRHEGSR